MLKEYLDFMMDYLLSLKTYRGGGEIRVKILHMLLGKRNSRFLKNGQLFGMHNTVGKTKKTGKIMQL